MTPLTTNFVRLVFKQSARYITDYLLLLLSPFFYLIDISLFIPFGLPCLSASEGKSPTVENEVRGPPISAKYPSTRTVAA